jgi:uncharacterized membrane protein
MAEHTAQQGAMDSSSHAATYEFFLRVLAAGIIHVFFVMVALVSFAFGHSASVFLGFAGLIIGTLAVLIDFRSRSRFFLSLGMLALFALVTAINVA